MDIKIFLKFGLIISLSICLFSCEKTNDDILQINQDFINDFEVDETKILDSILYQRHLYVDFSYPALTTSAWIYDLPIKFYEIKRVNRNNKIFLIFCSKYETKSEILDVRIATIENDKIYHNNPIWEKGIETKIKFDEQPLVAEIFILKEKIRIKYFMETGEIKANQK